MTRSIVIFVILVIAGSMNAVAGHCACGTDEPSGDKDVITDVHYANGTERIYDRLGNESKQMCVGYAADVDSNGIPNMTFSEGDVNQAIITNTCNPQENNGVIECMIEDPYFTSTENCYPAQYFCVHQVVCPHDHEAVIHCTSLGLPKKNGNCLDAVRINSGRVQGMTVCGITHNDCFPDINEAGGSLIRITFTSGFCCQHCGYRLWVRCVPEGQEKRKREIKGQVTNIESKSRFVVPAGAIVSYSKNWLTVKLDNKILLGRWTLRLQVKDDIAFGVGKLYDKRGTATRSFVGYGVMTVTYSNTFYHQMGIDPKYAPNSKERAFINKVVSQFSHTRFITSNINPISKRHLLTSVFQGRQKRSVAACQSVGETVSSVGKKCEHHDAPGPVPQSLCFQAKKYSFSKKPLVKYHATVFLKYKISECQRSNGVVGPPSG